MARSPKARGAARGGGKRGVVVGRVRDLSHAGEGVVATPAGVFFVPGTLRDELVSVRPVAAGRGRKGRARQARLLEVLEPSSQRVAPP